MDGRWLLMSSSSRNNPFSHACRANVAVTSLLMDAHMKIVSSVQAKGAFKLGKDTFCECARVVCVWQRKCSRCVEGRGEGRHLPYACGPDNSAI